MALPEDTPFVNTEGSSPSSVPANKKIFGSLVGVVVLVLVLGAGVYYYQSTKKSNISMTSQQQEQSSVPAKLLPYQETQSMTEADYDAYLAQKITGFNEGGLSDNIGFALFTFWDNTKAPFIGGDFGVRVQMVPIPNLVKFTNNKSVNMQITGVYDASGKDITGDKSDGFDEIINTQYLESPSQYLSAIDGGSLAAGSKVTDVAKITGILRLKLPINTTTIADDTVYVTKDFPFTLTPHAETPVVANQEPATLTPDQLQIQQSFVDFQKILNDKNAEAFKKYLTVLNPAIANVPSKPTDAEEAVQAMAMMQSFVIGDLTSADLELKTDVWKIDGDKASVTVKKQTEAMSSTESIGFKKINGQWYVAPEGL